jgi:hypothetical protein
MGMSEAEREAARAAMAGRYVGRPEVLVLDSYVMGVVGGLSAEKEGQVGLLAKSLYGGNAAAWREGVRKKYRVDEAVDGQIRAIWGQLRAREPGISVVALAVAVTDHLLLPRGEGK